MRLIPIKAERILESGVVRWVEFTPDEPLVECPGNRSSAASWTYSLNHYSNSGTTQCDAGRKYAQLDFEPYAAC